MARETASAPVSVKASESPVPSSLSHSHPLRNLRKGRLMFTDTPLAVDTLVAKRNQFQGALRALFPRRAPWAWVDMTLALLWLAAYRKSCFPSAEWVGAQARTPRETLIGQQVGPASRKSFFHMVAFLEEHELLVRHGTWKPPSASVKGRQSSNDYDLRALMRWLVRWLREWGARRRRGLRAPARIEEVGGTLWEKVGGFWGKLGSPAPTDTGPPALAPG